MAGEERSVWRVPRGNLRGRREREGRAKNKVRATVTDTPGPRVGESWRKEER